MRIGVDFDNTIADYEGVFHAAAIERGLIAADLPKGKNAVRDFLNDSGHKDDFTALQGYVYGSRMDLAQPYEGFSNFVAKARADAHDLFIVSHKTRHPFLGPRYDLHAAARTWIERHLTWDGRALLPAERIFFELTKEDKIARIAACGCDSFIDDLPEILLSEAFPAQTTRLLFDPEGHHADCNADKLPAFRDWQQLTRHFSA